VAAFLVEGYLSAATAEQLAAHCARASQAADELTAAGSPVAHVGTVYLPSDQSCLVLFESASADHVFETCRRASIPCDRVTGAVLAGLLTASGRSAAGPVAGTPSTGEERS